MNEIVVLDVGHGNSSLLVSQASSAVFDAAPGATLIEAIQAYDLAIIDHLFISHADEDHLGGVAALLSLKWLTIRNLHINPDASKNGKGWNRLRRAVDDALTRGQLNYYPILSNNEDIQIGETVIKTLAPRWSTFISGPGGTTVQGDSINSNSASAVLSLFHREHPIVLISGDMGKVTLEQICADGHQMNAEVLIFPHHGGLSGGSNTAEFAHSLATLVQPKLTIFSIRRRSENPRPEVVAAVRRGAPHTHILCTQLSENCVARTAMVKAVTSAHLESLPGKGKLQGESCGGSVLIKLDGERTTYSPLQAHLDFIKANVPGALCRQ